MRGMELYKFLQQQGLGSRKFCRYLVDSGQVALNGQVIQDRELQVDAQSSGAWTLSGEPWQPLALPLYIMLHKPSGFETSHQPSHYPSVFSLLPASFVQLGISAVGRLDADTTGLLLLSTDGQFVHALTSPRRHVAKRYRVGLKHPWNDEQLQRLQSGVVLKDDPQAVRADALETPDALSLLLTISEGRYHQVKRMVAAAGNRVLSLHRDRLGGLALGDLEPGQWRLLSQDERCALGF
jgi:16S rRNA pseudouridine516 synthase